MLVNGVEIDSTDFSAPDGVTVTLATAAAVGDTVKVKTWLPRGLSDGYLKAEADARFLNLAGGQLTGNLGLGVAPYPWAQGKALDLNNSGLFGYSSGGVTGLTLAYNQYYNGTAWKAKETGASSLLQLNTASFRIFGSASVAANADVVLTPMLYVQKDYTLSLQNAVSTPGTGVAFPATQLASADANTLDDYEEGTWTPALGSSGATPTLGYLGQSGTYTKVGRVVTLTFDVQWNSMSGGSGTLALVGLPFAVAGTRGGFMFGYAQSNTTAWLGGYGAVGNSFMWVTYRPGTAGSTEASTAQLGASGQFIGTIVYTTN